MAGLREEPWRDVAETAVERRTCVMRKLLRVLSVPVHLALVIVASIATADELDKALNKAYSSVWADEVSRDDLDRRVTDFENACNSLAKQYTQPEQLGRIYSRLATIYGSSDVTLRTAKTCEYAQKALTYPLDPPQKLLMYTYWGDAIHIAASLTPATDWAEARRQSATCYLTGLKETIQYNLPEQAPDLPNVGRFRYDGATDTQEARKLRAERDKQLEARKLAVFQRDMVSQRDTLIGQIAYLYSRDPFAVGEVRKLAADILADEATTKRLMQRVDVEVNQALDNMRRQTLREVPVDMNLLSSEATVPDESLPAVTTPPAGSTASTGPVRAPETNSPDLPRSRFAIPLVAAVVVTLLVLLAVALIRRSRGM